GFDLFDRPSHYEGAVFNSASNYVPPDVVDLCSYRGLTFSEYLTTTRPGCPPFGAFGPGMLQGRIYQLSHTTSTPLYLYSNTVARHYITTTQLMSLPPPWDSGVTIGYLPR